MHPNFLIINCFSQAIAYYDNINFEDSCSNLYFDSSEPPIWQIGTPNKTFFDSAYSSRNAIITDTVNYYPINNKVHEKGYRNKSLTDEQKASNKEKSKNRAKVEHVFGFMEQSINNLTVKSTGIKGQQV